MTSVTVDALGDLYSWYQRKERASYLKLKEKKFLTPS